MRRALLVLVTLLLVITLSSSAASDSIDTEIKKVTNYAEDYETGNINYAKLSVYISASREKLNEALGAVGREEGGLLKQEQLRPVLGKPTKETDWVWVEKEERETRIDEPVPVWEKIIFDGNKIQIRLNAYPSMFKKDGQESLIYRLHFSTEFKKPKEQLDIQEKISKVKKLAEAFDADVTLENAEALAKASVNVERAFESFFRQVGDECKDVMKDLFGSENQRKTEKLLVRQADFYVGKNYVVPLRLEMCDDCEGSWINLDFWIEGRGPGFKPPKEISSETVPNEVFESYSDSDFENEITKTLEDAKSLLESGDYVAALLLKARLSQLNDMWNRKSGDVWREVDKLFEEKRKSLEQSQNQEQYWWIELDQEKKQKERALRKEKYEERKEFYTSLLSDYETKDFQFTQINFEKRLVEKFKVFGKEICNNNEDDNKNDKVDCDDEQCAGKICGQQSIAVLEGNETKEVLKNLYCIASTCQLKEEIVEPAAVICGNHICEANETNETCAEDCTQCRVYEAINCSGKVIFGGVDESNCPLEPICLNETNVCEISEDCGQPLCGKAECIENTCKVTGLEACKEAECADGEEKSKDCESGEKIIVAACVDSAWKETGAECEVAEANITSCEEYCVAQPHIMCEGEWRISGIYPDCVCDFVCSAEEASDECAVREDCGNPNDVCSNGRCTAIPEAAPEQPVEEAPSEELIQEPAPEEQVPQPSEEQPLQQEEQQAQPQEQQQIIEEQGPTITGQMFRVMKLDINTFTGLVAAAFGFKVSEAGEEPQVEEQQSAPEEPSQPEEQEPEQPSEEQQEQQPGEEQQQEDEAQREADEREEREEQEERERQEEKERRQREQEERERREEEDKQRCKENCARACSDRLIAPCVGRCVWESPCEGMSCVSEQIKTCEDSCSKGKDTKPCESECYDKCVKGEEWQPPESEEENKHEAGVFKVGGQCRTSQQKTEGFIYFDGWGEPFEKMRPLKIKYYEGGEADWCKSDLENLKKQRTEFEKSFNQEFAEWFFEKYLANSAEDWEQHVSGIFELFWRDVDISREMAFRLNCLNIKELPAHNLISIKYETDYGKLEFWEEVKTVRLPGLEEETQVISPYMKIWIFPPKSFIIHELKQSMKKHEFPGSPEEKTDRKNEEGPTAEEKIEIRKDANFMKKVKDFGERYGGTADVVIQFKDYETNAVAFNLYAQVSEADILKVVPMLPAEVPQEDVRMELDFAKLYDLIYTSEKEMSGERIENPPWDKKEQPIQKVKEVFNGIKMYFKVRDMISSAKIYPASEEGTARSMLNAFFVMMMKKGMGGEEKQQEKQQEKLSQE